MIRNVSFAKNVYFLNYLLNAELISNEDSAKKIFVEWSKNIDVNLVNIINTHICSNLNLAKEIWESIDSGRWSGSLGSNELPGLGSLFGLTSKSTVEENDQNTQKKANQNGSPQFQVGTLERYEKVSKVFPSGGMGEVWKAVDLHFQREVILKKAKLSLSASSCIRGLFLLESEITGFLDHPGVPPVYSAGIDENGDYFYAMKFIKGCTLKEKINYIHSNKKFFKLPEIIKTIIDICSIIHFSHIKGIIHCDIKPDNVLIDDFGEVYVIDWGLALLKKFEPPEFDDSKHFIPSPSAKLGLHANQGGLRDFVGGTRGYMSPEAAKAVEQASIHSLDHRTDIYSIAATLHHAVFGSAPNHEVEKKKTRGKLPIPAPIASVIKKGMENDSGKRFATAREMSEDLNRFLNGGNVTCHKYSIFERFNGFINKYTKQIVAFLVTALVVGSVAYFFLLEEKKNKESAYKTTFQIAKDGFANLRLFQSLLPQDDYYLDRHRGYLYQIKDQMINLAKKDNDFDAYIESIKIMLEIGDWCYLESRYSEALDLCNQAKDIYDSIKFRIREEDKKTVQLKVLNRSFRLFVSTGKVQMALDAFHELKGIMENGNTEIDLNELYLFVSSACSLSSFVRFDFGLVGLLDHIRSGENKLLSNQRFRPKILFVIICLKLTEIEKLPKNDFAEFAIIKLLKDLRIEEQKLTWETLYPSEFRYLKFDFYNSTRIFCGQGDILQIFGEQFVDQLGFSKKMTFGDLRNLFLFLNESADPDFIIFHQDLIFEVVNKLLEEVYRNPPNFFAYYYLLKFSEQLEAVYWNFGFVGFSRDIAAQKSVLMGIILDRFGFLP